MKANLFVTCLVDQFFPRVGEAVVRVLERVGVEVGFPRDQTCCGQPAFNAGYRREARAVAERLLETFPADEAVVVPSGSCATMLRRFYGELFPDRPDLRARWEELRKRIFEFSEFLVDHLGVVDVGARFPGRVAYHDSCHLLRELGIAEPPRKLLGAVEGLELVELDPEKTCCGFGGLFSVKEAPVSDAILRGKLEQVRRSRADFVVANDMGCLVHLGGGLSRHGSAVKVLHLAEILASSKDGSGPTEERSRL
ncbi:MAG: hypothetical protein KatS3mg076_1613 [Candidatus Binatia bacterium]|nr:MAG: hypothetical protein KatS3mg076_1613 [Candidatus Binatia bacterium]